MGGGGYFQGVGFLGELYVGKWDAPKTSEHVQFQRRHHLVARAGSFSVKQDGLDTENKESRGMKKTVEGDGPRTNQIIRGDNVADRGVRLKAMENI